MKLKKFLSDKKTQKCMYFSFFVLALFQFYFFQEMLAALLLFTVGFLLIASIALVLYLLDVGFRSSIDLLEAHSRSSFSSSSNAAVSAPIQQDGLRVTELQTGLVGPGANRDRRYGSKNYQTFRENMRLTTYSAKNGKTFLKLNERLKASAPSTSTKEISGQA